MSKISNPTIALIKGDGIGIEVTDAALQIVEAAVEKSGGPKLQYDEIDAGGVVQRGRQLIGRCRLGAQREQPVLQSDVDVGLSEGLSSERDGPGKQAPDHQATQR